jgi:hypothetical protein
MKRLIPIIVLLFTIIIYAQDEDFDKMELRDGQVFIGEVLKIKADVVEFKDNETGLTYENEKEDIRYILLANGKVLTFEEELKSAQEDKTETTQTTPVVTEKDDGSPVGLIILATVGVVLVVLLLIGAAAQ